ncbi:YfiR family protein [Pseudodesulfovibrio sp. zrk46]|uniref:YfiR family protein n=1 Tax=Pseudodesulfovibrio sp. zrk46 TaxID=2725288 RepID=UPI001448D812|nr:YfiR family protein [Pseudodesulfovibrio sp. zrk46]QJB57230.1 YfiR family protein [Pseudodesulfovibrio sp. zrk46]
MRVLRVVIYACLIWVLLIPTKASIGGSTKLSASADHLRALFVQRLVKYVNWPEGVGPKPGEPIIVAATDPESLRPYFKGKSASAFELVQWPAETYHVLVLTGTPERETAAILKRTNGHPVLTIGQNPVNLRLGIVVNFHMVNGKLKLQINPEAARQSGLSISSKLLKIAQIYRGDVHD